MKKLIMLTVAAFASAMSLIADEETVGDYTWTYRIDGDTAEVAGVNPGSGVITIPSTLGGKPVTSIGELAFGYQQELRGVVIPEGVTIIRSMAFFECSCLEYVVLPSTLRQLDERAFYRCAITSITIPQDLSSIGWHAFGSCTNLSNVTFAGNESDIDIDATAFRNTALDFSLIVSDGVLLGYRGMCPTNLVIGDYAVGVTSIGEFAFQYDELSSITIPSSVVEIQRDAFYECLNLGEVVFLGDKNSIAIDKSAFAGTPYEASFPFELIIRDGVLTDFTGACPSELTIPNSVRSIGEDVFYLRQHPSAANLEKVTFSDGLESIGDRAFYNCYNLGEISLPSTVTNIGYNAFGACYAVTNIVLNEGLLSIEYGAFGGGTTTNITLPTTVREINREAFIGTEGTVTVHAPWSLWGVLDSGEVYQEWWSGESGESYVVTTKVEVVFYGDEPNFYTVGFDVNGGDALSENERSIMDGRAIGFLPAPTKSDYIFLGWFTAAESGVQVTADTVVTGDMTLYAHWEASPFTAAGGDAAWSVDLDGSWRSGTITDSQSSWIELAVTNGPCLVSFKWKTSSESGWDKLHCYLDGTEIVSDISGMMDEWANVSFVVAESGNHAIRFEYAKDGGALDGEDCGWVKDFALVVVETRALTLDANGGLVNGDATVGMSVVDGCAIGRLPVPVWNGEGARRFVGWFTADEGVDEVAATTIMVDEVITIYAHWRDINPPSNDNFVDAIEIQGPIGIANGTNIDATTEDYFCAEEGDVWWKWTAPASGKTSFEVRGSQNMGFCLSIATGNSLESLDEIVCVDDDEYEGFCHVEFDAEADATYLILVGGSGTTYHGQDGQELSRLGDFVLAWSMVPANDEYDNAQMLTSLEAGSVTGTLLGATIADNDCIWRYGDAERTVWYKWVAPFTGNARFAATADNGRSDLLYIVATHGYDEVNEEWNDCGYDRGNSVIFKVQEGETYYVSLATWNYVVNGFSLSWYRLLPPDNDNFADATTINGEFGRVKGSNVGASVEEDEPLPFEEEVDWTFDTAASVWWKWTAPKSGSFTFKTLGSDFDTVMGVYTGNAVGNLSREDANDEGFGDGTSFVTFAAFAGTTYYIAVGGYGARTGSIALSWTAGGELIPLIAANASAEIVTNAVDAVGFVDGAVKDVIGGSAEKYNAFKVWADGVNVPIGNDGEGVAATLAGEEAVVANEHAAAAYLLGAERLFENTPTIDVLDMVVSRQDGDSASQGDISMMVGVLVKDGENAVACTAERVKELFEATTDVGDWNGAAKLEPTVTVVEGGDSVAGEIRPMHFKVVPGDGTTARAFLRLKVK